MGLFGLIGLILVIIGVWKLLTTAAVLSSLILIVVGLVIASWGGGIYLRGRTGPPL